MSANFKPAPVMPDGLPPLPMGMNGKPLVYLGTGGIFKTTGRLCYMPKAETWGIQEWCGTGSEKKHYVAESDSKVCRLNCWGDFAPVEPFVPKFGMMPDNPPAKLSALEVWQAEAKAIRDHASQEATAALESAAAWMDRRDQFDAILSRFEADPAIARKAWFEEGRRVERHHGKLPTSFPPMPGAK